LAAEARRENDRKETRRKNKKKSKMLVAEDAQVTLIESSVEGSRAIICHEEEAVEVHRRATMIVFH
jgi:hypothetical protein